MSLLPRTTLHSDSEHRPPLRWDVHNVPGHCEWSLNVMGRGERDA
jgi:hypothetical protein